MNFSKKNFLITCLLVLFSTKSHALIYAAADAKLGLGTNASSDGTSIKSRSLINYSLEGSLGLNYLGFIAGVSGEYSLVKQVTKPAKVGNSNTQGTLTAVYPMIGYDFLTFRIIAKLPSAIMSEYTLDKTNSSGSKVTYKSADALGLQVHLISSPIDFWGVEYETLTFKKVNQGGSDVTLAAASKFKVSSFSLLYGFFF
jgi:hypothetical protein